jgi:hypothetical protein
MKIVLLTESEVEPRAAPPADGVAAPAQDRVAGSAYVVHSDAGPIRVDGLDRLTDSEWSAFAGLS